VDLYGPANRETKVAASDSFPPSIVSPVGDAAGSSMFDVPSLHCSSPATTRAIGSGALPPRFFVSYVNAGGPPLLDHMSSYSASLVTSTSTLPSTTPPSLPRARTHLQNNIVKPKRMCSWDDLLCQLLFHW
jgi:hypothetical protein